MAEVKEKPINLAKKVTVIGTKESKHMVTGREYQVQSDLAERLAKEGHVTIKK